MREERREEGLLLPDTTWMSCVLSCLSELEQPKRGKRRDDQALAIKYFQLIVSELAINRRNKQQKLLNVYHLRRDRIRKKLGEFKQDNQRRHWLHWFEQQPCSLYSIIKSGSNINEENTQVKLNWDFLTDLEIESVPREIIEQHYNQITNDYITTDIDLTSLKLFIERSRESRRTKRRWDKRTNSYVPAHKEWLDKNDENLKQAVKILKLAEATGSLQQPYEYSAFGRQYLKGVNLQNCSKTVRHAALGHCWSIDFNVCSTAWRLDIAQDICPDFTAPETLRLIKDKHEFRWDLAKVLGHKGSSIAKQVLTAIGFGADFNKRAWPGPDGQAQSPAIQELIGAHGIELLERCDWFMQFMTEQSSMNDIIVQGALAITPKRDLPACVKDSLGRFSNKNKLLAYLYQQTERQYMQQLEDFIVKHWGQQEILLTVHDGIYVKRKVPMQEINSLLLHLNKYLTADCKEHWGHFIKQSQEDKTTWWDEEARAHKQQAEAFYDYFYRRHGERCEDGSGL